MMEFFTPVSLPVDLPAIAHADALGTGHARESQGKCPKK